MSEAGVLDGIEVDFDDLDPYARYKLMASLIVPRPIALVTTIDLAGIVNAAPFSMFAMVGEDPPLVMISLNRLTHGAQKDTAANIDSTGEFVAHMVDAPIAQQMHDCGGPFAREIDELRQVGLTPVPARAVAPPRIAEAPVAFECTLHERIVTASRQIYFGQIRTMHAAPGLVDTTLWRVRLQDYAPIARFGASFYTTTNDRFSLRSDAIDGEGTAENITAIDEY